MVILTSLRGLVLCLSSHFSSYWTAWIDSICSKKVSNWTVWLMSCLFICSLIFKVLDNNSHLYCAPFEATPPKKKTDSKNSEQVSWGRHVLENGVIELGCSLWHAWNASTWRTKCDMAIAALSQLAALKLHTHAILLVVVKKKRDNVSDRPPPGTGSSVASGGL